jgi:hypothetical protein
VAVAEEHICRMKGGAQSHLLRCRYKDSQGREQRDGYFIDKFQNNPQHVRILANELLSNRLAEHIGLPAPHCEQVEVSPELIAGTAEMRMELLHGSEACAPGRQFGSQFPGNPRTTAVFDWVADEVLDRLENLSAFAGILAFDQWTCNTNGRQVVYHRDGRYRVLMIDQGFCFNAAEWNFPDAPLRGLYSRRRVYKRITGLDAFSPWLERIQELDAADLDRFCREIPLEWQGNLDDLERLAEQLYRRRKRVVELLLAVKKSSANPFPKWG